MKTPNISIIIPTYNESEYIEKCLEAVMAQLQPGDEVLLVDNNSTDDTVELARQFKGVTVLHEARQGQVHAQARGFDTARNTILARIDADSIVATGWLERIRAHYTAGHTAAITGPGISYELIMRTIPDYMMGFWTFTTNKLISGHYPVWGSNFAMPRSTWEALQPHLRFKQDVWEDFEIGIRMADIGMPACYDPKLLVGYSNRSVDIRNSFAKAIFYQYKAPKTYYVCGRQAQAFVSFFERTVMIVAVSPLYLCELALQSATGLILQCLRYTRPISQRFGSWL